MQGTSSTLTRNSEELLKRIKGLEDALLQVKNFFVVVYEAVVVLHLIGCAISRARSNLSKLISAIVTFFSDLHSFPSPALHVFLVHP